MAPVRAPVSRICRPLAVLGTSAAPRGRVVKPQPASRYIGIAAPHLLTSIRTTTVRVPLHRCRGLPRYTRPQALLLSSLASRTPAPRSVQKVRDHRPVEVPRQDRQIASEEQLTKRSRLLETMRVTLTDKSLHKGSIRNYNSAVKVFLEFGRSIGFSATDILPEDSETPLNTQAVQLWIMDLIENGVAANGIAGKISALKWWCDTSGRSHNLDARPLVRLIGAARRSNTFPVVKAKPVSDPRRYSNVLWHLHQPRSKAFPHATICHSHFMFRGFHAN